MPRKQVFEEPCAHTDRSILSNGLHSFLHTIQKYVTPRALFTLFSEKHSQKSSCVCGAWLYESPRVGGQRGADDVEEDHIYISIYKYIDIYGGVASEAEDLCTVQGEHRMAWRRTSQPVSQRTSE